MCEEDGVLNAEAVQAKHIVKKLIRERRETDEPVFTLRDKRVVGRLDLRHRIINVALDIRNCTFQDEVDLRYCEFKQAVDFSECTFCRDFYSGDEEQSHTIYRKDLICKEATFKGAARFNGIRVEGSANFSGASFRNGKRPVVFRTTFFEKNLDCTKATFKGPTNFNCLKCGDSGLFSEAEFGSKEELDFAHASFGTKLDCRETTFKGPANFGSLECGDSGLFNGASFESRKGINSFGHASFGVKLDCRETTFQGPANFGSLKCGDSALFSEARFEDERAIEEEGGIDFRYGSFGADLNCTNARFKGGATFKRVECNGFGLFDNALFESEKGVNFAFAYFGSKLRFEHARFAGPVDLTATRVAHELVLTEAKFHQEVTLYGATIRMLRLYGDCTCEKDLLDLRECTFETFYGSEKEDDDFRIAQDFAKAQNARVFSTDPYLQLEKHYRRIGRDRQANEIYYQGRLAHRENAIEENKWSWGQNVLDWLWKWVTRYGVSLKRLLLIAFVFLAIGIYVFSPNYTLRAKPSTGGEQNSSIEALYRAENLDGEEQESASSHGGLVYRTAYSLDQFLPLVNLHVDEKWEPYPDDPWTQAYSVLHAVVGWLVVPLLIAALAGIIKR